MSGAFSALVASKGVVGLHVLETSESTLCDLSWAVARDDKRAAVRTIRGSKSRTPEAFFDEVGAALQFPYYFGENWDAFAELIGEMSWMPAQHYLLVFSSAEQILRDATARDFTILVETLLETREAWGDLVLHAVFQCATPEASAELRARLDATKVAYDAIEPR
ncbi:MAG TPA: barstar family protein [Polyangiaceae bacterium]